MKQAWGPFADRLKNSAVIWFTDSAPGVAVTRKGSMKQDLNPLAKKFSEICEDKEIELQVRWLRRSKNKVADTLSRFTDLDDWGISEALLQQIQEEWGLLEVDRFANESNAKLKRFNSHFACPGSEAVDAFSQDWWHQCGKLQIFGLFFFHGRAQLEQ